MSFRWLAALVVCCGTSCAVNSTTHADVANAEILYIPLPITTYTAVTVDNIDTEGSCVLEADAEAFQWLTHLAPGTARDFDGQNVRAEIRLGTTAVYVDSNGIVLTPRGQSGLSANEKSALVASLESLRKASSCNRYDWLDK